MSSGNCLSRRELLSITAGMVGTAALEALSLDAVAAPAGVKGSPVAIGRCSTYGHAAVARSLDGLFDKIGGIRSLVAGKTVTIKVNATGSLDRVPGQPSVTEFHTHPAVVWAAITLFTRAGARRVRVVESTTSLGGLERFLHDSGWDLNGMRAAGRWVDFEDTRNLGRSRKYARFPVPGGGLIFPAYDLNHSYADTDVFVSIAKMKAHALAGVTLSMKNLFGMTPNSLYGDDAGTENATESRMAILHEGYQDPPAGAPAQKAGVSRSVEERIPRIVTDLNRARPVHLAVIDGVATVAGAEGPWQWPVRRIRPGLLIVGRNAVCVDSVATKAMGYNPMARKGAEPFGGENHLAIASALGMGTNDPARIEVRGLTVAEARCPFGEIGRDSPPWQRRHRHRAEE